MKYEYIFNSNKCWFKETCKDFKDKERCTQFCRRYGDLHYQANHSLLKIRQQYPPKLDIPEEDKKSYERLLKIRTNIYDYVKGGNNLLLQSNICGNGKTTWMTKLAMQYMSKLKDIDKPRVLFINCPQFLIMHKNMFGGYTHEDLHYILDNIEHVDLVIWDDVVISSLTNTDYLNLYVYINSRIDSGKSNFYTINADNKTAKEILDERMYSRIYNNSEIITFNAGDSRVLNKLYK